MFDAVVTSGEAAWNLLRHRTQPGFAISAGAASCSRSAATWACSTISASRWWRTPEDADFLFNTGLEIPPRTLDDYRAVLERAPRAACRWSAPTPTGWRRRRAD